MGIDKHELEHRNWRSTKEPVRKEINNEMIEQLDTSIVPDDEELSAADKNEHAKTY